MKKLSKIDYSSLCCSRYVAFLSRPFSKYHARKATFVLVTFTSSIMLGFQYVVAKSRELSSALDRELSAASNRSIPFRSVPTSSSVETALPNDAVAATEAPVASSLSVRHEGHTFLNSQHKRYAEAVRNHDQLLKQYVSFLYLN